MRAKVVRRHTCHYPRRESEAPGNLGSGPHGFGYRSVCCTGGLAVAVKQRWCGVVLMVLIIFNGLDATFFLALS